MTSERVMRYGGPAAVLGGVMHVLAFVAVYLIYFAFAEEAKGTFFGEHAFICCSSGRSRSTAPRPGRSAGSARPASSWRLLASGSR